MAIHREAPYRDVRWDNRLPQTEYITDNTIILPLFHTMTEEEQSYVIDCIAQVRP
jgi:dTDP-4-amino-4,6-dideoxygalactose transaminase